jgi:hypothetical protein
VTPYGLVLTVCVTACVTRARRRYPFAGSNRKCTGQRSATTECMLTQRTSAGTSLIDCPPLTMWGAGLEGDGSGVEYPTVITDTDIL